MIENLQFKKLAQENVQNCPFCDMPQEGIVNGIVINYPKDKGGHAEIEINEEKFYSFCNCKNIFFTNWSNIEPWVYDKNYQNKYSGVEKMPIFLKETLNTFNTFEKNSGVFIEIGVVHDGILDCAKSKGMDCYAVDINPDLQTKYDKIIGTIEDKELIKKLPKADLIWASHLIEHCHYPLKTIQSLYDTLNSDGLLYIAMPDPWMIPLDNPYQWGHWHYKEHHIMWDMDSFIDELLKIGFNLVYANRRILKTDYEILFKKP